MGEERDRGGLACILVCTCIIQESYKRCLARVWGASYNHCTQWAIRFLLIGQKGVCVCYTNREMRVGSDKEFQLVPVVWGWTTGCEETNTGPLSTGTLIF